MASRFFATRAKEITSLSEDLAKLPERGLAFQNVPFKCRRRAASHHRNRIPSRMRKFHDDIAPASKRPSKKYRKRRSEQERLEKRVKKCMHTHKWHAKRFHMTLIENKWVVPLTANDKCFRAVYRSVNQGAYVEDISYWQCIQINSSNLREIAQHFGKVIVNSVEYSDMSNYPKEFHEQENDCWLYNKSQNLLGLVKIFIRQDNIIWFWIHPRSFSQILEKLKQPNLQIVMREDLCRFRLLGPQAKSKMSEIEFNYGTTIIKLSNLSLSKFKESDENQEVLVVQVKGNWESGFGSGYDIIIHKDYAFKYWLDLAHNKVHVGCLDSQEQLDVEIGRISSVRLCQDILIPPNIENCDSVQKSLAKLFQNWTKTQNKHNFQIVRASKDIKEIEQSLKNKSSLSKLSGKFVPIHIDMCNGGTLDEGSRIFYPSIERNGKKFAKDVKHVAFIEYSDIGIVTAANFSQRRGISSGLGLISIDAIEAFKVDEPYVIAIEKEANGKYYLAQFKILI